MQPKLHKKVYYWVHSVIGPATRWMHGDGGQFVFSAISVYQVSGYQAIGQLPVHPMKTDWNCLEGGDQLVGDFFVSKFAINCRKHWMQFHLFSKSDDKLQRNMAILEARYLYLYLQQKMENLTDISLPNIDCSSDEFSFHLRVDQLLTTRSILQTAKQKRLSQGSLTGG